MEGIAKAKAAGVYNGRTSSINIGKVRKLKVDEIGPSQIAKIMGIGQASGHRILNHPPQ